MQKIAIILPAYNEEITIKRTIENFYEALPEAEIVVVNNNSSDSTGAIAEQVFKDLNAKGRVINESQQGKGFAVRHAFQKINADIYVMCDADQTYPADKVKELIEPVADGNADMVVGDRHSLGNYQSENKRRYHNIGNKVVRSLINRLFRAHLQDIMSGYRAYNRRFVKNYPILVPGFELETDMTLHALDKRFKIVEVPITYNDRPEGSNSKLNTFRDGAKVVFVIFQLLRYYRPLVFFGLLSMLFVCMSFISAIPVIIDWVTHQYIYHIPLAVLASALGVVSILLMGIGLLLDAINHQNRMRFEQSLIRGEGVE